MLKIFFNKSNKFPLDFVPEEQMKKSQNNSVALTISLNGLEIRDKMDKQVV